MAGCPLPSPVRRRAGLPAPEDVLRRDIGRLEVLVGVDERRSREGHEQPDGHERRVRSSHRPRRASPSTLDTMSGPDLASVAPVHPLSSRRRSDLVIKVPIAFAGARPALLPTTTWRFAFNTVL